MKLLPRFHYFWLLSLQYWNLVEAMTIATGCRIWIPCEDGFAVDAFSVAIIRMASSTFLDDPSLIPFPGCHFVDLFMAVFTLNVIDEMGACIMFRPFLLMTSMTGDGLRMNSSPFCFPMGFDIRDIPVATVAGVGSMNGLGKLPFTDFSMATQTFRVVNTFIAIFSSLDDKFFPLFPRLRRFGHLCRFGTLFFRSGCFCPHCD
jgi:hypothetical protein